MVIKHWPETERPREKLLVKGASALSDAELLAVFLRTGVKGQTAVDLARNMLHEFGNLKTLIESEHDTACQFTGFGPAKFVQLQAAIELGKRYLRCGLEREDVIVNPAQTKDFLTLKLKSYPHEVFACLFLDNKNQIIDFAELFRGTINGASVYCREVVKETLKHNAAAVIFAHNHPSGIAEPSHSDIAITEKLRQAMELIDVRLLDHIIVGDNHCQSFAELGLL